MKVLVCDILPSEMKSFEKEYREEIQTDFFGDFLAKKLGEGPEWNFLDLLFADDSMVIIFSIYRED